MTYPPGAVGRPEGGGRIARRRLEPGSGAMTSVATLLPAEPPPAPGPTGPVPARGAGVNVQMVLVAAALVIALVATVGVAMLWSANRKLASEVDAAVAQSELAEAESARLRVALEEAPDTATVEALAGRVDGVESWTGMPQELDGMDDLQTRLVEVSNGIDSLETNLEDGLGGVRNDLATVRNDLSSGPQPPSAADVDALRGEVGALRGDLSALRSSIEGIRQDVGVLCWALGYRKDVSASC
ncbi:MULTISPECIES: hypothetical protein [Isoptericola]|uniref:Uncharacterized protein n=1 Tax=Isoptericola sediminis TaxID=2733572 RepID=A0A849K0R8_9MICO|nr:MULTISPECIES: hypothetical protein [Isoptericola]MDO8145388.1 hypothetical protein [Isoptericola sp. 178]MDO8149029.1 hypothetical protein [Isoptericola sp. b515]MDO8151031.1 hypothetical protein [Isoptericola sp. b408]NNU28364.1 hypothetical protein [Isoptericola sediminis]